MAWGWGCFWLACWLRRLWQERQCDLVSVSSRISGNKPVPDDSGDVGGKDNSLVRRAPRQSEVSACWSGDLGSVPSPEESPGFGELGQVTDELC